MEPRPGFEPGTSSLPYICSAELLRLTLNDSAKTDSQNHRNTEEPRDRKLSRRKLSKNRLLCTGFIARFLNREFKKKPSAQTENYNF